MHSDDVNGLFLIMFVFLIFFALTHSNTSCDIQSPSRTSNILIIADPQILNSRSYPHRNLLLTCLSQLFADLNMRKSRCLVAMKMRPHVVVVLGNMMDGGQGDMDDDE